MGVPYPAMTIAAWFISQAKAGEEEPSSQKVHTLIGRAQSHYRARYGRPLLAEPMPVWPPGGPVPSDEHAVKASGASPAGPGDNDVSTEHGVDLATASFLGEVWDSYGGCFAGVKLVIPAARELSGRREAGSRAIAAVRPDAHHGTHVGGRVRYVPGLRQP